MNDNQTMKSRELDRQILEGFSKLTDENKIKFLDYAKTMLLADPTFVKKKKDTNYEI